MKFITNKCNSVGKKKHLSTNKINRPILKYIDSLN